MSAPVGPRRPVPEAAPAADRVNPPPRGLVMGNTTPYVIRYFDFWAEMLLAVRGALSLHRSPVSGQNGAFQPAVARSR